MKINSVLTGALALLTAALLCAPGQEAAQAQMAADAIIEEIVVTARRREERLEDLPLSVVAISGNALRAQGIYSTNQIGDMAANVILTNEDRRGVQMVHIRGIGGGFPTPVPVFGVGMYMDGHYLSGSLGNYMSTVDLERVEVLRGPQGTLFGKNVTGGAVNMISVKPQPEFESEILVRVGDFSQQDFRGMINVPFSENVFGRFTVAKEENDGYYKNRFLGTNSDRNDDTSFRGALRFTPGENWTIDATVLTNEFDGGEIGMGCVTRPTQSTVDNLANLHPDVVNGTPAYQAAVAANHPPQIYTGPVFADGIPQWGGAFTYPDGTEANVGGRVELIGAGTTLEMWEACNTDQSMGDYVNSGETFDYSKYGSDNLFLSAAWDSGGEIGGLDNLVIRTNWSWRDSEYTFAMDRDKTPVPLDTLGHAGEPGWTQVTRNFEIIFDGDVNDRLSFQAGLYWFDDESRTGDGQCWAKWESEYLPAFEQGLDPDVPCGPGAGGLGGLQFQWVPRPAGPGLPGRQFETQPGGSPGNGYQNINGFSESKAVFGHLTYALNDIWDLELGARWTEDDRNFSIVEFEAGQTCLFIGQQICEMRPVLNSFNVFENGFFNKEAEVFDEVTPMVSLSRNFAGGGTIDSGMIYGLIAEGFLSGGFNDELNLFLNPLLQPLASYGPEHVTNYEVGFKGTLADGRVRLNADIFFMDYTDKHEAINLDNSDGRFGPDPNIELTQNAAKVEIYGIELELRASPWDGGFLTVDFGYLENEYKNYLVDDPDNPGQQTDRSGLKVDDRQPDWTLNATLGHTFTLASGATLTPMLGVLALGDYEWQPEQALNGPRTPCFQDSYSRWRTRVTYTPAEGNWEASLIGENITDERYYNYCESSRSGIYDRAYGRPDWWGVEFVARWGEN